ncbi:hypothetical protein ACFQY0_05955 [Haloferula chungangensis]|uniref:Uncharacterized protein n=1 Tax=Haloferula chungangensis TaxID=1048331 RepID=A0ABW2L309_9BACT
MKNQLNSWLIAFLFLSLGSAFAYPPAPFHRIYGVVRDDHGNPLGSQDAIIVLDGMNNEIVRGPTDPNKAIGFNYSLSVPMDSGVTEQLYDINAMRPSYPFTLRVLYGGESYLPIQMQGSTWNIGLPAGSTRIDLTIGIDSDHDGLPDAWELEAIRNDPTGRYTTLASIKPDEDADGDGLTNLQEYIAGTYALDSGNGLSLDIISVVDGMAMLEFLAVDKRTYHLESSDDLSNFSKQEFSLARIGKTFTTAYLASDTRVIKIYVKVGEVKSKIFRLHAN